MENKRSWRKWLWYFSLITALIVLYKMCDSLKQVWEVLGQIIGILAPFIIGLALAFLLYGPSHWLEERFRRLKGKFWAKAARPLSLAIVYLLLLGFIALMIYLIIPRLVNSLTGLVLSIPDYLEKAQSRINEISRPDGLLAKFNLVSRLETVYHSFLDTAQQSLNTGTVLTAIRSVINVTTSVVSVIIAVVVSVYMLSGKEKLLRQCRSVFGLWIKPARLNRLGYYGYRIAGIFHSYFYGSLVDALIVGIVTSIGLALFRVPYPVLLGMMLGLLNMIPYFGSIIGGIGICLITLLSKNIYAALGVALYILVIQQVDSNFIEPHIVGDSVGLHPFYVLLGITVFGGLFRFWGVFLGAPIMAVIQLVIKETIARRAADAAAAKVPPAQAQTEEAADD